MAIPVKHFPLTSLLLLALLVISSAVAVSDSPFIVAHKKVALQRLKSGAERVTVSIDIYNHGSEVAYNVSLTDDNWGQDMFAFVNGETSNSWERLEGGTHVSHSFELGSKVKGKFYGAPACITFRKPTKAALQVAYSNDILPLDILADGPTENKFEWIHPLKFLRGF
ncbi:hypothetical protein SLEP1_g44486 [Rubroshorea leprosula]|uniref:Translocon-associated protein subunit beta n=1 Tax=Rubroshorea leprosula TaxID=152421 RepID=A0AAV5LGW6_9ROSI|nr:hypothetical protein SLEP1_g44486 [Rubroshorea leprosula]